MDHDHGKTMLEKYKIKTLVNSKRGSVALGFPLSKYTLKNYKEV